MKKYWSCMASIRGKAKPGCNQKIEAGPFDFKTLRQAGWKMRACGNKWRMVCPVCACPQDVRRPRVSDD